MHKIETENKAIRLCVGCDDEETESAEASARRDFSATAGDGLESAAKKMGILLNGTANARKLFLNGRDTVWPHDHRTGWSYCVTIPTWAVLPKSRDSDPVVFYRVQVGVQSPECITTKHVVLRRFNDFLKLFNDLRKAFPKKSIPPAPPKGLTRIKSREMLEERRRSLEEWMIKLLSDIDISRNFAMASFLELEAAARSSFEDVNHQASGATSSGNSLASSLEFHPNQHLSMIAGSSSSDTAYETSEIGTPRLGRETNSETGLDDLTMEDGLISPMEKLVKYGMENINGGLFMEETILKQLEDFPKHKVHAKHVNIVTVNNGNASNATILAGDRVVYLSEVENNKGISHARRISSESIGTDESSLRGDEMSNAGISNLSGDGSFDLHGCDEGLRSTEIPGNQDSQFSGIGQLVVPLDQRHKLNRFLLTMQRRLVTVKTDMEDLIARLNQEVAVKDYLSTKVKDLEVELETTKQKSKENLHQTMLSERERFTQMQWDMEELRRKCLEMELKLKSQQDGKPQVESKKVFPLEEKDALLQELDATRKQLQDMVKRQEELETKSRSDIKVLVKEVKSLRNSQTELKKELDQSVKDNSKAESLLQYERQKSEDEQASTRKLMHEFRALHNRLQECNINFLAEDGNGFVMDSSSFSEALDLLTTSDDRIGLIIAEAQLLTQDNLQNNVADMSNNHHRVDDELRKLLSDIFRENATLRKHVNSTFRGALKMKVISEKNDNELTSTDSTNHDVLDR